MDAETPETGEQGTTQEAPLAGGLIYRQMALVMKDVGPVGKNNQNAEQRYKFRSIEDVMNAVRVGLTKHGVFYMPTVTSRIPEERRTAGGKVMNTVHLEMRYDFYAEDGSSVSAVVWGEGADLADKATNKAMSAALKYALVQAFSIAAEDIEDSDRSAEEAGGSSSYQSAGEAFQNAQPAQENGRSTPRGPKPAEENGNGAVRQLHPHRQNGQAESKPSADPIAQALAGLAFTLSSKADATVRDLENQCYEQAKRKHKLNAPVDSPFVELPGEHPLIEVISHAKALMLPA